MYCDKIISIPLRLCMSSYAYALVNTSLKSLLQQTILTLPIQVCFTCVNSAELRQLKKDKAQWSHKDQKAIIALMCHKNMLTYLSDKQTVF